MSQPPLDSNRFGKNTTNGKTSPIDLIPVKNTPEPTPQTLPTDLPTLPTYPSEKNGKVHVPGDPDPEPSSSDLSSKNLIHRMMTIPVNQLKRNSIRRKSVVNTRNMTCQNYFQSILLFLTTVNTYANDITRIAIGKRIR